MDLNSQETYSFPKPDKSTMEISQAFGFLKILTESIKLLPRNGRFMASITFLSLLIPSVLLVLFIYLYRSITDSMTNYIMKSSDLSYLQLAMYLALLLLAEILFLTVFIIITHVSGIATVLVSSMSYSDKKVSQHDLFSRIKATWRKNLTKNFRTGSKNPMRYASVAFVLVFSLAIFYRVNPIIIAIAIVLGIAYFVFQLYSSVVLGLYHVVSIVEDSSNGTASLERAEQLVEGQRHHGFMFNLLLNLVFMIVLWGGWIGLDDMGGVVPYGLIILNSFSLWRIFWCVGYTVFYFQCRKQLGDQEIDDVVLLASFQYAKLPADTKLDNDIP